MPALSGELHHKAKLQEWQVWDIVWRYANGGCTYLSLATEYGVENGTISAILRGRTWKHVTGGVPVKAPPREPATHCHKGHELTEDNTVIVPRANRPNPSRQCKKCKYARTSAWAKRKRGNYRA